jgi:hypothetical protein
MATTTFTISTYSVSLSRDQTGAGASSSFDAVVRVTGEGNTVFIHFLNTDSITSPNIWNPAAKFGRIYMRRTILPIVTDILRNEKPVFCRMSDTVPDLCGISTGSEPMGEGEV